LKSGNQPESQDLQGDPYSWTRDLETIIGRNLEKDDSEVEKRVARVELVLCDTDVFEEIVGESIGDVTSFELFV
jgi:hypothetical protein